MLARVNSKVTCIGTNILFVYMMVILLGTNLYQVAGDNCTRYLHQLANSQKDYIDCATVNALPVGLCEGCRSKNADMRSNYTHVKQNCEEYFDANRFNLVENGETVLENIWSKAYCDDCLQNYDNLMEKGNAFDQCIQQPAKDICFQCLIEYNSLNQLYMQIEHERKGHICYDIQDMMYLKRHKWAKELNCSHHKSDLTLFIIVAVIVINLHIAFYGINYSITRRQEQRTHNILNDNDTLFIRPAVSTTTETAVSLPSTSAATAAVSTILDPLNADNIPQSTSTPPIIPIAKLI